MINTSKVADHRKLRFSSPEQLDAEVARLVAADRAGTLRGTGNWTLGQTLGHLAAWIEYGYDGYPAGFSVPWIIRRLSRLMKKKFIEGALKPGINLGKVEGGTLATELLSTDEGLARFQRAWGRLRKAPPDKPNGVFGPLTRDEWISLHLRHAELHLGFQHES
jgi:hypothetical protein